MSGPMDGLYLIVVIFSLSEKGMLRGHRLQVGDEEESDQNRFRHLISLPDQLICKLKEREKISLGFFSFQAVFPERPFKVGKEREEQTGLEHQLERGFGHALFQLPYKFIPKP